MIIVVVVVVVVVFTLTDRICSMILTIIDYYNCINYCIVFIVLLYTNFPVSRLHL